MSLLVFLTFAIGTTTPASAQELPAALDGPWTDVAPHIENERVLAAAVGLPDERFERSAARRAAARRSAAERARAMLHAWADDALARARASARTAAAIHRTIEARSEIVRVRPLADGGAVVEVAVTLAALRAVAPEDGLPWSQ